MIAAVEQTSERRRAVFYRTQELYSNLPERVKKINLGRSGRGPEGPGRAIRNPQDISLSAQSFAPAPLGFNRISQSFFTLPQPHVTVAAI
jgi:hypothetical protein